MRAVAPLSLAALTLLLAAPACAEPPAQKRPDLEGVWTNASTTRLERTAPYTTLTVPKAAAERAGRAAEARFEALNQPSDPSAGVFTDRNTQAGYNAFWVDPGTRLAEVKGEARTSWIVDPADGKIPLSDAGRRRLRDLRGAQGDFSGPETRPMGERCLIGFGNTGGPPMLNVLYNNHYQIVQAPGHVMILVEMNHDARIIPIVEKGAGDPRPDVIRPWLGSSVGWYEDGALVVETRRFHPTQVGRTPVNVTDAGKVTERFSRWSDDQILYEFTVEDPTLYTRPWKGEMSLNRDEERLYEYACHEGNYALDGILAGARIEEARGGAYAPVSDEEG